MITIKLSEEEIRERSQALAENAHSLAEIQSEEDELKAAHKTRIADIKERRAAVMHEIARLSRAVRLGVEWREQQERLFDPKDKDEAHGAAFAEAWIEEKEKQQASKEAVGQFFEEKCICGHSKRRHVNEDEPCHCQAIMCDCKEFKLPADGIYVCRGCGAEVEADLSATDGKCSRCWTPDDIQDPEERTAFLAENADDFTADRCSECGRIEGAHTKECSKSNALRFEDYEAYAKAHYKSNHKSHARKMELSKLKDDEVREWMLNFYRDSDERPKKRKRRGLDNVEEAIDR